MKKLVLLTIITLTAFTSSSFAVDRTWNFMKWSATTLANLTADPTNWNPASTTRFSNLTAITAGTTLTANGVAIAETNGLTFSAFAADKLRFDYNIVAPPTPDRLIMNGTNMTINVPDCSVGDTLVVYTKTASSSAARGITVPNATRISGAETSLDSIINVFTVTTAGVVAINNASGLQYRLIAISAPGKPAVNPLAGISTPTLNAVPVKTVYYNLSGLVAGHAFANLRKGLYIQKTWYNNGSVVNSKFVKATE
jgi:hypothetical protein